MKKIIAILSIALAITGLAFADTYVGVNVKGGADENIALELGASGDYLGAYGQVHITELAGLVGFTLSTPDTPFFGFFGAGAKIMTEDVYLVSNSKTKVKVRYENTFLSLSKRGLYYNSSDYRYDYLRTTNAVLSYTNQVAVPFMEAGLGIDMGPMYWKVGWTNFDGDTVTISAGASF